MAKTKNKKTGRRILWAVLIGIWAAACVVSAFGLTGPLVMLQDILTLGVFVTGGAGLFVGAFKGVPALINKLFKKNNQVEEPTQQYTYTRTMEKTPQLTQGQVVEADYEMIPESTQTKKTNKTR